MTKVFIKNDGKEKGNSYEACLELDPDNDCSQHTYSYSSEHAIEFMKEKVKRRIKELKNIDWDSFDIV